MAREMKTQGRESTMVFADGQRIDYPRYRVSANGFIRGPRNEQLGRGKELTGKASEFCREVQQQWMDQFNRFKVGFLGVAVPTELFGLYDSMMRNAKPFANQQLDLVIKAYWRDEPDCYDILQVKLTKPYYGEQGSASLNVYHMPLRKLPFADAPSPFDEFGTIRQMYVPITNMISWTRSQRTNLRAAAGHLRGWLDEIEGLLGDQYVSYVCSQEIPEVKSGIDEWLEGTSVVAAISPHLKEAARLFTEIGYVVEDNSTETVVNFKITDGDHEVTITANGLEVTCLFEKDEDRLASLQKMRLKYEYEESLKIHGDLTDVAFTEPL